MVRMVFDTRSMHYYLFDVEAAYETSRQFYLHLNL